MQFRGSSGRAVEQGIGANHHVTKLARITLPARRRQSISAHQGVLNALAPRRIDSGQTMCSHKMGALPGRNSSGQSVRRGTKIPCYAGPVGHVRNSPENRLPGRGHQCSSIFAEAVAILMTDPIDRVVHSAQGVTHVSGTNQNRLQYQKGGAPKRTRNENWRITVVA